MPRLLILAAWLGGIAYGGVACTEDLDALAGRNVDGVRVSVPLSFSSPVLDRIFFNSLSARVAQAAPSLAIQATQKFDIAAYSAGQFQLSELIAASQRKLARFQLAVVLPRIEDCSATGLTVVYNIYSTEPATSLMSMAEFNPRITQTLAPAIAGSSAAKIISPLIGYNASRGVYGGTALKMRVNSRVFKTAQMLVAAAPGNMRLGLDLAGDREFGAKLLNRGEWRIDYRYLDEPVAGSPTKLHSATLDAQFLGTTRVTTKGSVAGEYGIAVEGGNRQSNLTPQAAAGSLSSSSYGGLRGYLGVGFAVGRHKASASYGILAGKSPDSLEVGYLKHVVDLRLAQRYLPKPHVPIYVDLALNAGWIQSSSGQIPVNEMFYGGNAQREFVTGDRWKIRGGPYLRSFAESTFNSVPGGPFGATRFTSMNLTVAPTWKRYPVVPDDILQDPILRSALGFQLSSLKESFVNDCSVRAEPFPDVVRSIRPIQPIATRVEAWVARLRNLTLPSSVTDLLDTVVDDGLDPLKKKLVDVLTRSESALAVSAARAIAGSADPNDTLLAVLADAAEELADAVSGTPAQGEEQNIRESVRELRAALTPARDAWMKLEELNTADPARYRQVAAQFSELQAALEALQMPLAAVMGSENALQYLEDALRKLRVASSPAGEAKLYDNLDTLLLDWGDVAPASPRSLEETVADLQRALEKAGQTSGARSLDAPLARLRRAHAAILAPWRAVARPPTQSCALAESQFAVRAADTAFRELNLFQISPVGIFDVARLSTPGLGSTGVRYGAGPGLRFSLATLNLTGGYAFNVQRRAGESRGALFFTLDVSDLFR